MTAKIYPNPASDAVTLKFDSNEGLNAQIVVSDLMGRSIVSKNVEILRGVNEQNLNISNLPNGIYFVQLRSQNRILFTEKVIKQ